MSSIIEYIDNLKELIRSAHRLNRYTKIVSDSTIYEFRRELIKSIYGDSGQHYVDSLIKQGYSVRLEDD